MGDLGDDDKQSTFTRGHWIALALGVGLVVWGLTQVILGS